MSYRLIRVEECNEGEKGCPFFDLRLELDGEQGHPDGYLPYSYCMHPLTHNKYIDYGAPRDFPSWCPLVQN